MAGNSIDGIPASAKLPAGSGEGWAEDYELGRPGWPSTTLRGLGLPDSARVLDVAAGTGKLTRVLHSAFGDVTAVEPQPAMRRILERSCPSVRALAGDAEHLPLDSVAMDAVFIAQAFHKFASASATREIARVLRPGGLVVLLWNVPLGPWRPDITDAERLLQAIAPNAADLQYDPLDLSDWHRTAPWRDSFRASGFGAFEEDSIQHEQHLDHEGVLAFLASMGWFADLPDAERVPLMHRLRSLVPVRDYSRTWTADVYWASSSIPWR